MAEPVFDPLKYVMLLPGNQAAGDVSLVDRSINGLDVLSLGNTEHSDAMSKWYGTSIYLDGSGDYITCNEVATILSGLTHWAVGGWFYLPALMTGQNTLFGFHTSTGGNRLVVTRDIVFGSYGSTRTFSTPVNTGSWHHVALQLHATGFDIYLDGLNVEAVSAPGFNVQAGDRFSIGQEWDTNTPTDFIRGHINDFFVYDGELITGAFDPPSSVLGSISGTVTSDTGSPAERRIVAVPRKLPLSGARDTVSAVDGQYSVSDLVRGAKYSVVAMDDDAGVVLPDLVQVAQAV